MQTQTPAYSDRIPGTGFLAYTLQKDGVLRRVLDERGRVFGRINVIDLLVLLVILAIVVFAGIRLTGGESVQTVPVKISFLDTRVSQALLPGLQTKGTVKDQGGNVIGEVQSIDVTPSIDELLTTEGELKTFASTTHSDVTFVVLAQGTVHDSTVHVGRLTARVGADVRLIGPGYEVQTVITKVVWGAEALK